MSLYTCILCFGVLVLMNTPNPTTAQVQSNNLSEGTVNTCISGYKNIFDKSIANSNENIQETRNRMTEKARKISEDYINNLKSLIDNGKTTLDGAKRDAIDDHYDVESCNVSSAQYDEINTNYQKDIQTIEDNLLSQLDRLQADTTTQLAKFNTELDTFNKQMDDCKKKIEQNQNNSGSITCMDTLLRDCNTKMTSITISVSDVATTFEKRTQASLDSAMDQMKRTFQDKSRIMQNILDVTKACFRNSRVETTTDSGADSVMMISSLFVGVVVFLTVC